MPFDGHNEHSVVVQGNCAIHHVKEIDMTQKSSCSTYIPPYSPDYNLIEEAFSKAESMMKAMEAELELVDTYCSSAFLKKTVWDG
jgi:transposase